jgi:hypothetical protein
VYIYIYIYIKRIKGCRRWTSVVNGNQPPPLPLPAVGSRRAQVRNGLAAG